MEYIVPSISRCGSKVVCRLVSQATGRAIKPAHTIEHLSIETGDVRHTHVHLTRDLPYEYRAVFVFGRIGDSIASIYNGRVSLMRHLRAMNVADDALDVFERVVTESRQAAFAWLIEGDKFGYRDNVGSWRESERTVFVRYEELCGPQKRGEIERISNFLGVDLPDFDVQFRSSALSQLPLALQVMIREEYGDAA